MSDMPPESPEAAPASLSTRRKLLFLVILSVFGLGLAEIAVRVLMVDTEIRLPLKDGGLLRPYVPNSEAELVSQEFRVRYRINEWGYRDKPGRRLEKTEGKRRIVLLGDSFTEGYGVEFEATYAQKLEASHPQWETWNTARMGSSPLFYVFQLRHCVPKLQPDLALIQIFDNDLNENEFRHAKVDDKGQVGPLPDALKPPELGFQAPESALLRAWRRVRRRLKGKPLPRLFVKPGRPVSPESLVFKGRIDAEQQFNFYGAKDPTEWQSRFQRQASLLRQLIEEFRARCPKAKLALLYVPHVIAFAKQSRFDLTKLQRDNWHSQCLKAVCQETQTPFMDATEFLIKDAPRSCYFERDLHWNAKGHSCAAKALGPWIEKLLR